MYFWMAANILTARPALSAFSFSSEVGMQSCAHACSSRSPVKPLPGTFPAK
jgi:hypothetical protein